MRIKYKGQPKKLLIIFVFFAFLLSVGYQGNIGPIAPPSNDQFPNSPNEGGLLASAKYYKWADNGSVVCDYSGTQIGPKIVADGVGGAISVWVDQRGGNIYAQRINASGVGIWTANGVSLCSFSSSKSTILICSDGNRGAIVVWQDLRNGMDVYSQRVNSLGAPLWGANALPICNRAGDQYPSAIISDGNGGAIITCVEL